MSEPLLAVAETNSAALDRKLVELRAVVRSRGRLLVAASGGVDSTLVWAVAREELGDGVLAVTAVSPSYSGRERATIERLKTEIGGEHAFVETGELDDPRYAANPTHRCYFCKLALWEALSSVARNRGFDTLADGLNADDLGTHRPGHGAGIEFDVVSPLAEVGFSKDEVRNAARRLGLSNWDKPAMACLSSRFAYGVPIDAEELSRVERAESLLYDLGFDRLRVRVHGNDLVRIEVRPADLSRLLEVRERVIEGFRALGFVHVSLDLEGYRSGSMNESAGGG